MANSIAKLAIMLTADTSKLSAGFAQAQAKVQGFGSQMAGMGGGAGSGGMFAGLLSKANLATAAIAGIGAAVAGATWATKIAADNQKIETSFKTMLGSAEKAKSMMGEIQSFAAATPFETSELAGASKSLIAFGVAQQQVIPTMRMLGDMASGLNMPLGDLAQLYGKAKVQGRLFAEDMNQFQGRGIPIVQQLAKNFGVAENQIRGMVESGQVGFPQLHAALVELTKKGSMFGGAMADQSKTFWGQVSTLTDNLKIAFGGVGNAFIGQLTDMLAQINRALDAWNQWWGNSKESSGKFGKLDPKLMQEGMKPMVDAGKALEASAAAAAKSAEKLAADGKSLADSLRTPFEKVVDELRHAKALWDAGAISGETWARAMERAKGDLAEQVKSTQKIRDNQGGPVAALQFGTQQAITAMNEARRQQVNKEALQKQELDEARKATALLQRAVRLLEGETTVQVNEVNL